MQQTDNFIHYEPDWY